MWISEFECYSSCTVLVTVSCDVKEKGNHILGEECLFLLVNDEALTDCNIQYICKLVMIRNVFVIIHFDKSTSSEWARSTHGAVIGDNKKTCRITCACTADVSHFLFTGGTGRDHSASRDCGGAAGPVHAAVCEQLKAQFCQHKSTNPCSLSASSSSRVSASVGWLVCFVHTCQ